MEAARSSGEQHYTAPYNLRKRKIPESREGAPPMKKASLAPGKTSVGAVAGSSSSQGEGRTLQQRQLQPVTPVHYPLDIRLSEITTDTGSPVGLGLFTKAGEEGEVFSPGQTILEMKGTPALRTMLKNGKELEWLFDGKRCCGLTRDTGRYVVWSDFSIPASKTASGKTRWVVPGLRPDDLSVYANDSHRLREPNISIDIDIPDKLKERKIQGLTLSDLPGYRLNAKNSIPASTELLWSYDGEEGKGIVDFETSYQQSFEKERDSKIVEKITRSIMACPEKLEVMDDMQAFNIQHHLEKLTPAPYKARYTDEEKACLDQFPPLGKADALLKLAELDSVALSAYLKYRFENNSDKNKVIEYCRIMYNRKKERQKALPCKGSNAKGLHVVSKADVYRFCVENNIFTPEEDCSAISLEWLGDELKNKPHDPRLHSLLADRIRYALCQENFGVVQFTANLNMFVPNPLGLEKRWELNDLEAVSGFTVKTFDNNKQIEEDIANYQTPSATRGEIMSISKRTMVPMSYRGHLDASKARIQYLIKQKSYKQVLWQLMRTNLQLPVNRAYRKVNDQVLTDFIRENFEPEEIRSMLPLTKLSNEILLEEITKGRHGAIGTLIDRIKEKKDMTLFKKYVQAKCKKWGGKPIKGLRYTVVDSLRKCNLVNKPDKDIQFDDLFKLFKNDVDQWELGVLMKPLPGAKGVS
ncbi:MAG: hypothetical protein ACR2PX_21650 [Endozoicomonas sp.]|uniref:hypothetical protein n=1 Tax=Endozoicomonas sp. TaxID=1892382 RepID=UPI003D9B3B25